MREKWEFAMKSSMKIVSVVDDDIDISKLFQIALSENMEGITVFSFNDPILALEHFNENKVNTFLLFLI